MSKQIAVTLYKDGQVFSQGRLNPQDLEALATKLSAYGITICKGKPKDSDRCWINTLGRVDKKLPKTQDILTYPCNEIALRAAIGRRKDAEF